MTKLLIKYKDSYICEKYRNEIDFISVPNYYPNNEPFSNLSIFITLLLSKNLTPDYSSKNKLNENTWSTLFEKYFIPEYLHQVDTNSYIYDLDEILKEYPEYQSYYEGIVSQLQFPLILKKPNELKNNTEPINITEDTLYDWIYPLVTINKELETFIAKRHQERKSNDCLLLYSGGKDSTLAAIRLYKAGYNIHFIHFNNGYMLDGDKPYLTYQETFGKEKDYYFNYELSNIDIKQLFDEYFQSLSSSIQNNPELLSEIRCLSCRLAMYTKAIQIAKQEGYKYIAEGARISQKFMLEQIPITNRLKELAREYGIKLLLPVLYLEDDQKEIEELIESGHSSKTWESKCLIGRPPMNKTAEDESLIVDCYDRILIENVQKKLKQIK